MTSSYFQGYEGFVKFNATGGAAATLTAVKSWTIRVTKEIFQSTRAGDSYVRTSGGIISGSGSAELIYDGGNNSFIEAVNSPGDAGLALFELYLSSTKKIVFNGIIQEATYGTSPDDAQIINCNYVTNGIITLDL